MFIVQKFVCASNGTTTVYRMTRRVFSVEPSGCATVRHCVPVTVPDRIAVR